MSRALVPVRREAVIAEVIDDDPPPRKPARRADRGTPVELRLPGRLGGMKARVDRKTSNTMATTFLGGMLVAIGAVLFAMFGDKSRA